MKVSALAWDSDFFGFKVGRVIISQGEIVSCEALRNAIDGLKSTLVYVFVPKNERVQLDSGLSRIGKKYDVRTTFGKTFDMESWGDVAVDCVDEMSEEIKLLAYASGWCSRFNEDVRLRPYFKALYKQWLENDLLHGAVLVARTGKHIVGLATVNKIGSEGKIGLVAVDPNQRGKGIGSRILKMTDAWFCQNGITHSEVVTQGKNIAACALYKKAGYELQSQYEVWHIWK